MQRHSPGSFALLGLVALLAGPPAWAQMDPIVYDGRFGNTVPGQVVPLNSGFYVITDNEGTFSGTHLFFGFDRFGVPAGTTAFFFDQTFSSQAIIAAVSGSTPSEIFGQIDVGTIRPQADFFLLNPQGIYVGPNASFNVGGDTYLTSAERLHWAPDGTSFFDVTGLSPDSVLSPTDPVAFGFLAENPAPIGIYGATLGLSADTTFALAGGVVEIVGSDLTKPSGDVALAAVRGGAQELLLPLDFASLDPEGADLGPVRLGTSGLRGDPRLPAAVTTLLAALPDSPATVDVSPGGALDPGTVVIRGEEFVMRDGELLDVAGAGSPSAPAQGDFAVDIAVSGAVAFQESAQVLVENVTGPPLGGAIRVAGASLVVEGDSQLVSQNTAANAGGAIDIRTGERVDVRDGGQVFSQAVGAASAPGGDVTVVVAAEGGEIVVEGASPGMGGGDPRVSQIGALTESTNPGGDGGTLTLDATNVSVRGGGQVRTSTFAAGDAGSLNVLAENLLVSGVGDGVPVNSGLFALTAGDGAGGALSVDADTVTVENGGRVSASTRSGADAGELRITARRLAVGGGPDGVGIVLAETTAGGQGGDVVIRADEVQLSGGGGLSTTTTSTGDAGDIDVAARTVDVSGSSGIVARNTGGFDAGDAGSVLVDVSERLSLVDGSEISVISVENGAAGDVRITGGGDVVLANGASIRASLGGSLRAPSFPGEDLTADVSIEGMRSLSLNDAFITTETAGNGAGGDITVTTAGPVTLQNGSRLTARSTSLLADAGNAGRIDVTAGDTLAVVTGSRIETSTEGPASGGAIGLHAGELVYLSDATISTDVNPPEMTDGDPVDGGDVVISRPEFVVLNRSTVVARARGSADAGNILIEATEGFFPSSPLLDSIDPPVPGASVLDATAGPAGVPGTVAISSPSADLVSQVTPLPTEYLDATRLLTTPCEARRARRGSLTVQTRPALELPPDALFGASRAAGGLADDTAPAGICRAS